MLVTLLSDRAPRSSSRASRATIRVKPEPKRAASATAPSTASSAASSKCDGGWCRIEIGKREGYIRTGDIWGVGEGEVFDD